MRTPMVRDSYLQRPLNALLGTPGSVRVLRELVAADAVTFSVSTLAKQTRLNAQTVRNALNELAECGIVETLGEGRSVLYRAELSHPLYLPLATLFKAEAERFQTVLEAIASAVGHIAPRPLSAWIYGAVARGEDLPSTNLDIAIVAADEQAEATAARLRDLIAPIQEVQRVWISVVGLSPSMVRSMAPSDGWWRGATEPYVLLFGETPATLAATLQRAQRSRTPFSR